MKALKAMERSGILEDERKKKVASGYMCFLASERVENKKLGASKIASKEMVKDAGKKWREMTPKLKKTWNARAEDALKAKEEDASQAKEEDAGGDASGSESSVVGVVVEKVVVAVVEKKKKKKAMKKAELVTLLAEKLGDSEKSLKKKTVVELRTMLSTVPDKSVEGGEVAGLTDAEFSDALNLNKEGSMFEMSESDSDSE
jgi:hypothetical protein